VKILVTGCSFAEHLTPVIKKHIPQATVTNLARWGVGNKYISDSVVLATLKEKFDLIYVSWTGFSRYDVCIDTEHEPLFSDWSTKKKLFDKFYVCTGGIGGWDYHNHHFANLLFTGYHKFVDHEQLHYNSLLEILKIQGFLENFGVPFYFTGMLNQFKIDPNNMFFHTCEYGVTRYPSNQKIVDQINFDHWIFNNGDGIYDTVDKVNMISPDDFHPTMQGYDYWIDLVTHRLKKDKIL
jgi:hypothetical protein